MEQREPGPLAGGTGSAAATTRRFRPELQGLRALAVALVVVYHVWFGRVSGGVDVFFLVSGFLVTGQLYRAAERGALRFGPLWARQAARLLPAAFVVLTATAIAGWLLLPEARWQQTLRELFASAFFLENWQLAADSVDYAARHNTQSLVQHFWSLSIQVQFYLVWPLLVALVALAAGTARERLRTNLLLTVGGLFAASLTFSVALTITNQPLAYFHSLTRVWEFALGGLLALTIDSVVLGRRWRILLGWLGVVALVACGALLQVDAVFPGFAALWPTGAAALVLVAGATGSRVGADRLLSSRPLRYLGDVSYALYLWHWPVLVLVLIAMGREVYGLRGGLLVIGISMVLAVLTHHLVEEPIRRARVSDRARYRGAAAGLAVVLLAATAWQVETASRATATAVLGDPAHPGAMALRTQDTPLTGNAALLPPLVSAQDDWANLGSWPCTPMIMVVDGAACRLPPLDPAHPPVKRMAIVGDSHSQQMTAALVPWAHARNVELIVMLHGACPYSTESEVYPGDPACLGFNDAVAAELAELRPDAVFTLASRNAGPGLTETTPPGFVDRWRELDAQGAAVVAFRDNPRYPAGFRPADCLQELGRAAAACGQERAAIYAPVAPYATLPDVPANVTFVDFSGLWCTADLCPAEIGNVLTYLDDNHLTATFAASMAPAVQEELDQVLGW